MLQRLPAFAAAAAAALLAACAAPPTASPTTAPPGPPLTPPAALRLEGVPPLPAALLERAQRYNGVSGHAFLEWHPVRREMLVAHRAPDASTTQLWLLRAPMAAPEPLTDGPDPVGNATWEPREGRYVLFSRGRGGDEAFQLFRLDLATRATTQITAAGERHGLLAWVRPQSLALIASQPLDRTAEGGRRAEIRTTVTLLDPARPAERRVVAQLPGGGWASGEVSPDGRQVALQRYVSATESEVWLMDLSDGKRRRLLPAADNAPRASYGARSWSPDGRTLYVTSDRIGEFDELMRLDLASGALTRLTAGTSWDVVRERLSPDGRQIAAVFNVDGRNELRLIDSQTGAPQPLPPLPAGSVARSDFHPALGDIAMTVNGARAPAQVVVVDAQRRGATAWTAPVGTEGLDLQSLPEQQIVRWQSFDGRTISGMLSLPPARFTGRRPVMMVMHGGPESQARIGWRGRWNYLVEQMGVALFEPNVRGSSGYGKTFLDLDNGRLREDSVKDMASAIDWIATQPRLDATRVMVSGGSYGGYMALAASTVLADRIAAASATVGISNFVSFLENTESYRRDLRRAEYGDERDPAMRTFLQGISPLTHAARITKPLMVTQGKNDPRVPWTESEQIVRSLQQRGTPVWYLLADNEGHGFARRENADFQFAALLKFVEDTLRP